MENTRHVLFRGDTFAPSTQKPLLAKKYLSNVKTDISKEYSVFDHVKTNPSDSEWISFTKCVAVSLWFAVYRAKVGETVYVSMWNIPKTKCTETYPECMHDKKASQYAKITEEFVVKGCVSPWCLSGVCELLVNQDDKDWAANFKSRKGNFKKDDPIPAARRQQFIENGFMEDDRGEEEED